MLLETKELKFNFKLLHHIEEPCFVYATGGLQNWAVIYQETLVCAFTDDSDYLLFTQWLRQLIDPQTGWLCSPGRPCEIKAQFHSSSV